MKYRYLAFLFFLLFSTTSSVSQNPNFYLNANGANGSSVFSDASSSAHSILVTGTPINDTICGDTAVYIDGTNWQPNGQYLFSPSSPDFNLSNSDFTVHFWTYLLDNTTHTAFDLRSDPNNIADHIALIHYPTTGWLFSDRGVMPTIVTENTPATKLQEWTHVALVRSGNTFYIFINGCAVATGNASITLRNNKGLSIGYSWDGRDQLNGFIDEFYLYNGTALWTSDFEPPKASFFSSCKTPMSASISTTSISCSGEKTGTVSVMGTGGETPYTYQWSPNAMGQTTQTITGLGAGIYRVTISSAGCNPDTVVAAVSVNEPTEMLLNATVSDSNICSGDSSNLSVSVTGGVSPYTYLWDNAQTQSSITISPSNSLTTQISVTDQNNCQKTQSFFIYVNSNPTPDFTFTSSCLNDTTFFINTTPSTPNVVRWHWDFGAINSTNDTSDNENTKYIYTDSSGFYAVTLIAETDSGCVDSTSKLVESYPIPVVNFIPDTVCLKDSTQFQDLSTVSSGKINTWSWNFGGSGLSSKQHPKWLFPLGTHNVSLSVTTDKGCQDDTLIKVGVYPLPSAGFFYTDSCSNTQPIHFFDTSKSSNGNSLVKWEWDFGDNVGSSSIQNPPYNFATNGSYVVTLVVTSDKTCTDTIKTNVNIHPAPIVDFTADITSGCQPLCVDFTASNTETNISDLSWNFGDNKTSTLPNIKNCYKTSGTYDVSLKITSDKGCIDSTFKSDYITVWELPKADFLLNPQAATVLDTKMEFTDISEGNIEKWNWKIYNTDGNILGDTSIQSLNFIFPGDTGKYPVMLIVTTTEGCLDSAWQFAIIDPTFSVYIPSAFSPNRDNLNDTFFPVGIGINTMKEFNFQIFDRWGELLFRSNHLQTGWDGIAHEKGGTTIVQPGVYIWTLDLVDFTEREEKHNYTGLVTVIK